MNNILGPKLPMKLDYPVMVTSPTGKGIIFMGGTREFEKMYGITDSDMISKPVEFELSESMEWTKLNLLNPSLQCVNFRSFAIPIPDELVYEKRKTKTDNKRRKLHVE